MERRNPRAQTASSVRLVHSVDPELAPYLVTKVDKCVVVHLVEMMSTLALEIANQLTRRGNDASEEDR